MTTPNTLATLEALVLRYPELAKDCYHSAIFSINFVRHQKICHTCGYVWPADEEPVPQRILLQRPALLVAIMSLKDFESIHARTDGTWAAFFADPENEKVWPGYGDTPLAAAIDALVQREKDARN
jgi:hypothetical protein